MMPFLLAAVFGAAPLPVRTEALDLKTALDLAAQNDERPALARARAAEAQAAYRQAWSRLLPTLSVSGTYRRRAFEVEVPQETRTAVIQANDALASEGRFSMRLVDASAIVDLQSADLTTEARSVEAHETDRRLAFETAEAFYAALAADRTFDAAQRRVALATTTSSDALARFDAGLAALRDVNRTRLDEAEARQSLAEAVRAQRLARITLGFLVGVEPKGALLVPKQSKSVSFAQPVSRPDIEAARILLASASRAAWGPWLSMIPTVDLVASLRATNETGFQDRIFNWDISVLATWVLYDGGARYAEAKRRAAQLETARLNLAALERTAHVELARAGADLNASLSILAQASTRAELAEENRDEVTARFARGLASALEVADAATSAFAAHVALEQARFEAASAALQVRNAGGAWPLDS